MKIQTLNGKIALALFVLIGLTSGFYIYISVQSTQLYQQEIQQKLNRSLAQHIAKDIPLLSDGTANQAALEDLFHTLMIVNPSIELYLLDTKGTIMSFNAPPGKVKLDRVDMVPVYSFLEEGNDLPVRGNDPRSPGRHKVFSAAPVFENQNLAGYLYIVLGGENYDTVVEMIRDSYILRLLFWIGISVALLSLLVGIISFYWLTRRVRQIGSDVEGFKNSEFKAPISLVGWRRESVGDEIDSMGTTVEKMSQVIVDQFQQLRQADITRRELIANISHDLRTPLTSMRGYLETLQIKKDQLSSDEQEKFIELSIQHSDRLSALITDLFELAMLESPDSAAEMEYFSLAELAHDVILKFEVKTSRKNLQVSCDIPQDSPSVHGDIAMIERVLENLIENAIKFSHQGGALSLRVAPRDGKLEVKVVDTGIGIAAEDIPNLFQRFYCVDKSRSARNRSSGLGLAIAHRILQLHGGDIKVSSMPGKGSCFFFSLPIAST
ncbi:MAG: two-component sensor histidine kinase [Proteobacteria bacterium]|nr:two-component sensor histidine kinase [Pseudomonadota bacterium]